MNIINPFQLKHIKMSNLIKNFKDQIYCIRKELYIKFKYNNLLSTESYTRKTDKVFILAGGASVAHIKDSDWEYISQFDTAALNYFYVHDFVPDLLFVEINPDTELIDYFVDNCVKASRYDESMLVLQYKHAEKTSLVNNQVVNDRVKYFVPEKLNCSSPKELACYWKFRSKRSSKRLVHHSSHLGALIDYCVKIGFKDILIFSTGVTK